jgi:hypothetical protein
MIFLPLDPPVDPDRPEAHDLLQEELLKPEYLQAKPTPWDNFIGDLTDWINHLTFGQAQGPPAFGLLIVVLVIVALLVIAFFVFGLPRINRRSRVTGSLFGEDDARTAAQMRTAAEAAAAKSDYATAIAEMFRSIARGLAERTILSTSPGTTAHDFGARAALAFPQETRALADAALAFDDVRYLGRPGTPAQYDAIQRLERQLRATRSASLEVVDS